MASAPPVETEIKLSIQPARLAALRRHALLAGVAPERRKLHSVYYDTADHQLAHANIALRVRRVCGKWILTLKTEGKRTAGLSVRPEWEAELPGAYPDLAFLPADARAILPRPVLTQPLIPLYSMVFWRTQWKLLGMEIALDRGEIQAANQTSPILELEIEARQADVVELFGVARQLAADLGLAPLPFSKAERGLILAGLLAARPSRAMPIELNPAMTVSQAFCVIAGACLDQWQRNLPGLVQSEDLEYLHQTRIAVRRLGSAISLFKPFLSSNAGEYSARLRPLMQALGAARDLDVLVRETWVDLNPDLLPIPQSTRLLARLEYEQKAAQARMIAETNATHTTLLMLDLGRWIAESDQSSAARQAPALTEFANAALARLHKRLSKRISHIREFSPEERHATRIAAKKLRYAVEFLGSLYERKAVLPYVTALAEIQDQLGTLNDAAVAMRLLDTIGQALKIRYVAGFASGLFAAQSNAALGKVWKLGKRFLGLKPFWEQ